MSFFCIIFFNKTNSSIKQNQSNIIIFKKTNLVSLLMASPDLSDTRVSLKSVIVTDWLSELINNPN